MLVLFETASGFAVFKLLDPGKLKNVDQLCNDFESAESASKIVQLADFHKFKDSAEALAAAVALNEGSMVKSLKSLLKKVMKKELQRKLVVLDSKLGTSIKSKLPDLQIVSNSSVGELIRCIRGQVGALLPGITDKESNAMMLGLGHNLSRYKLKFSPDKVDTMVVQAVSLLDDLDKELNNYVMRAKEWYGWHFPELAKILTDNTSYIHTVHKMGFRENAKHTDFSSIMDDDMAERVKEAAEVSMGCEINDLDIKYMQELCTQIIELTDYRRHLSEYLSQRMVALAPNLTVMVGELIGARLIAHSGSLINLAKNPASTIQLIGAEKALFKALKTHKATPKYGLIYHAELVSKSAAKDKGKMSRMLAAKTALAARVDAIAETSYTDFSMRNKYKLQLRIERWNTGSSDRISGQGRSASFQPHHNDRTGDNSRYHSGADNVGKRARPADDGDGVQPPSSKRIKHEHGVNEGASTSASAVIAQGEAEEASPAPATKKEKKKKRQSLAAEQQEETEQDDSQLEEPQESRKKKKKDKKIKEEAVEVKQEDEEDETDLNLSQSKKKKKKDKKRRQEEQTEAMEEDADESVQEPPTSEKKKKKKKKHTADEE